MHYLYTNTDIDGNIFYVGKGTDNRCHEDIRSKEWEKKALGGHLTNIIKFSRNNKEILFLEKLLIKSLSEDGIDLANVVHNTVKRHANRKKERIEYWRSRQSLEAQ
jgi:hypothetical protein